VRPSSVLAIPAVVTAQVQVQRPQRSENDLEVRRTTVTLGDEEGVCATAAWTGC
jgi:hypothetical protein